VVGFAGKQVSIVFQAAIAGAVAGILTAQRGSSLAAPAASCLAMVHAVLPFISGSGTFSLSRVIRFGAESRVAHVGNESRMVHFGSHESEYRDNVFRVEL
jgi:hypothetical protein